MSNVIILGKQETCFDFCGGELVWFNLHHGVSMVDLSFLESWSIQHVMMGWSRLVQGLADLLELRSLLCADPVKGAMSSVGWHPAAVALTSRNCWYPSTSHGMCSLFHCCSHPETRLHTLLKSSSQFRNYLAPIMNFEFPGLIRHTLKNPERTLPLIRIYVS